MNYDLRRTLAGLSCGVLLVGGGGGGAVLLGGGPLNPPAGAVMGTAKPLSEVEPRVAINAANTPGDADSLLRISQPGSYYLTGNIAGVAAKSGIEIAANGVTIDLMGFSLTGVPGSLGGIAAPFSAQNLIVRNGVVSAWGADGINLGGASAVVESVIADSNGQDGVDVGSNSVVRACVGRSNVLRGILVGTGCTVTACAAANNGAEGINTNSRCTVTLCAAEGNTGDGISGVFGTAITDCSSGSNTGAGISISQGGIVMRCFVASNGGDGIVTASDGTIVGNACDQNGNGGTAAGILATGPDNRIEGNNCTDSDFGIRLETGGNIVIRNTCSGNTTVDWDFAANNNHGPILDRRTSAGAAVSGFSAPSTLGSTDPNANYSY